jgi:hypothetical protein
MNSLPNELWLKIVEYLIFDIKLLGFREYFSYRNISNFKSTCRSNYNRVNLLIDLKSIRIGRKVEYFEYTIKRALQKRILPDPDFYERVIEYCDGDISWANGIYLTRLHDLGRSLEQDTK